MFYSFGGFGEGYAPIPFSFVHPFIFCQSIFDNCVDRQHNMPVNVSSKSTNLSTYSSFHPFIPPLIPPSASRNHIMQGFITPYPRTLSLITMRGPWWEPSDIFYPIFPFTLFFPIPAALPWNLCIIPFFFSPLPLGSLCPTPAPYLHLIACNGGRPRRQIGAIQYSSIWAELVIRPIHPRPALIWPNGPEESWYEALNSLWGLKWM